MLPRNRQQKWTVDHSVDRFQEHSQVLAQGQCLVEMTVVGQVHHGFNKPGRDIDFGLLCERPQLFRTTHQRCAELLIDLQIERRFFLVCLNQALRTTPHQRFPRLAEFLAKTPQILVERGRRKRLNGQALTTVHAAHDD